jgi:hypothetical protein
MRPPQLRISVTDITPKKPKGFWAGFKEYSSVVTAILGFVWTIGIGVAGYMITHHQSQVGLADFRFKLIEELLDPNKQKVASLAIASQPDEAFPILNELFAVSDLALPAGDVVVEIYENETMPSGSLQDSVGLLRLAFSSPGCRPVPCLSKIDT